MTEISKSPPWKLIKLVLPQHTDHAGVMWHGAYLAFLEEARIDALSQVGLTYAKISIEGYEMPVVDFHIKYMTPFFHGDEVILESSVLPKKGPRITWKTNFSNNW